MSISINGGMDLDAFRLQNSSKMNSNSADKIAGAAGKLSANSTDEELTEAVKSFESYFVEQLLKEFKETKEIFGGDSSDTSISMMSDLYMDSTISDLATELVDKYAGNLTEQLVEHMKLSYGITDDRRAAAASDEVSAPADDSAKVEDKAADEANKTQEV